MAWPNPNDYAEALQNPRGAFNDVDLARTRVITNRFGLPRPISGNYATVFEVTDAGRRWAVRCFLREVVNQQQRYSAISAHLQENPLGCMVPFVYLPEGIKVRGKWYPALKMEWASGSRLDAYIEQHLDEPRALEGLAEQWVELCGILRRAHIAHGDFQHGNILITDENEVKLLDYDGMLVPGAVALPTYEIGHRHYQHPSRQSDQGITVTNFQNIDNFSAHVIASSLQALSIDPSLWQQTKAGEENLLFRDIDYRTKAMSDTFRMLQDHSDRRIRQIGQKLTQLAQSSWYLDVPPLEQTPTNGWTARVRLWLNDNLALPPASTLVTPLTPLTAASNRMSWWSDHLESPTVDFDPSEVDRQMETIHAEFESSLLRYFPLLFREFAALKLMESYPKFAVVIQKTRLERSEWALNDHLALLKARHDASLANLNLSKRRLLDECSALANEIERLSQALESIDTQEERDIKSMEHLLGFVQEALSKQIIEAGRIPGIGRSRVEMLAKVGIYTAVDITPANEAQAKYVLSGFRNALPEQDWDQLVQWRVSFERTLLPPALDSISWEQTAQTKRKFAERRRIVTQTRAAEQAKLESAQQHSIHLQRIEQFRTELQIIETETAAITQKLVATRDNLQHYSHITLRKLLKRVLI